MSDVGHKRTFALQQTMSALPPTAHIRSAKWNVRFGPIADVRDRKSLKHPSYNQTAAVCARFGAS
jgi:hypothetical protein